MNDIKNALFGVYGYVLKHGYICIDESMVNWNSRHKLLPIKLMLLDYVNVEEVRDENGEKIQAETKH